MSKKTPQNLQKVLEVFSKEPRNVPLEVFHKNPYKTLVSTIMSSRTKDETTLDASKRLFKKAPNIKKLDQLGELEIRDLIYPVGFYKTKAKHLKKLTKALIVKFDSKVPVTRSNLVSLPGVGRKTANLILNRAFGKPAIAVDTHVHRISNLIGWVNTKNPDQTEEKLMEIIPKKYWGEINTLFVSVGRNHNSKKKLEEFLKSKQLLK
ncbi:endonuclease III [Candidatus Woesebacteria bacterium]|nr:endonuclease III [Candidatus Woesebacteria bacterium]